MIFSYQNIKTDLKKLHIYFSFFSQFLNIAMMSSGNHGNQCFLVSIIGPGVTKLNVEFGF